MIGTGYCSFYYSNAGTLGLVLAIAASHSAIATRHSATTSWFYVACPYDYRDCSLPAHIVACFDYYHYPSDSSVTASWASELGTAGCKVCLTF
jgi:hypothetical protein